MYVYMRVSWYFYVFYFLESVLGIFLVIHTKNGQNRQNISSLVGTNQGRFVDSALHYFKK